MKVGTTTLWISLSLYHFYIAAKDNDGWFLVFGIVSLQLSQVKFYIPLLELYKL